MPEMTNVFIEVTEKPDEFSLESPLMSFFEKLTCREYSKTLKVEEVNESREHMFIKVSKCLENIPLTKNNGLLPLCLCIGKCLRFEF